MFINADHDCTFTLLVLDDAPRCNSSLQTLSFCLTAPGQPRRSSGRYTWIPQFLSRVGSAQVSTIELRCDCQQPTQLERLFLREIDEVLSRSAFPKLRRVVVTVPNTLLGCRESEVSAALQKELAFVSKQRLLEVAYKPVDYERTPALESALTLPC